MSSLADLLRFDDQVALVTGGYGGIGAAVSRGLVELGAKVAIAGHNEDTARAFAAEIGGFAMSADGRRVVVVATLDNLLKGAATQAMQNINLALGFDELTGIPHD